MVYRWSVVARILKITFSREYFSIRYTVWIIFILLLKNLILLTARLIQAFDPIFFRKYKQTEVEAPIYILANPRSGTTFLHRLLCQDPQFTYFKLYQTMFPSVLWYRFFQILSKVDGWVGRPLYKLILTPLNRIFFGGWDGVHKAGFDQAEEDETTWMYIWATPGAILFTPFLRYMDDILFADRLDDVYKEKLSRYLMSTIQKHMYVEGPGKTYLAKNAVAAGRIKVYIDAMPDMRVVHLYRHPYESIASALSMFCAIWKIHSPASFGDTPDTRYAAKMWCDHYRILTNLRSALPESQYIEFAYTDFVADPKATVEEIYRKFDLDVSEEFTQFLDAENKRAHNYESVHEYNLEEYGIDKDWIYNELSDVFERYGFDR